MEVLFGIGSALSVVISIDLQQAMVAHWATLTGCAYVVARGLNNFTDAKKSSKWEMMNPLAGSCVANFASCATTVEEKGPSEAPLTMTSKWLSGWGCVGTPSKRRLAFTPYGTALGGRVYSDRRKLIMSCCSGSLSRLNRSITKFASLPGLRCARIASTRFLVRPS